MFFLRVFFAVIVIENIVHGASTSYENGTEVGTVRCDTVVTGAAGNFNGYTAPGSNIKTLKISIVSKGVAAANDADTLTTSFPDSVKEIYFLGDAADLNTVIGGQARGFPTPADGCTVHFKLTNSPSGACSWFVATTLPTKCSVVFEQAGEDPLLPVDYLQGDLTNITFGMPYTTLTGTIPALTVKRSKEVSEANASVNGEAGALITLAGDTTFSGKVEGLAFTGAHTLTLNNTSSLVDLSGTVTGITVGSGKTLTLISAASKHSYDLSNITYGTLAKLVVKDNFPHP